jgi:Heliorhodopsin
MPRASRWSRSPLSGLCGRRCAKFALNQWLQYRAVGRWRDYLFAERLNILLSLTAKSALAWQVFAGTLAS